MESSRDAYVLFGGVGSGKTAIAEQLAKASDTLLVSADQLIFQHDLDIFHGRALQDSHNYRHIIPRSQHAHLVIDMMAMQSILDLVRASRRQITAVFLDITREVREKRFDKRHEKRKRLLRELSDIMGRDLSSMSMWQLRSACIQPASFRHITDPAIGKRILELVKEIYLLGAYIFKDEHPDPLDFTGVDYVMRYGESARLSDVTMEKVRAQRVSFAEYREDKLIEDMTFPV